jgi:hypothetical protein
MRRHVSVYGFVVASADQTSRARCRCGPSALPGASICATGLSEDRPCPWRMPPAAQMISSTARSWGCPAGRPRGPFRGERPGSPACASCRVARPDPPGCARDGACRTERRSERPQSLRQSRPSFAYQPLRPQLSPLVVGYAVGILFVGRAFGAARAMMRIVCSRVTPAGRRAGQTANPTVGAWSAECAALVVAVGRGRTDQAAGVDYSQALECEGMLRGDQAD